MQIGEVWREPEDFKYNRKTAINKIRIFLYLESNILFIIKLSK